MAATDSNEAERRRWNDCAWAAAWPKREQLTTAVTDVLLTQTGLQPGDAVLDIGTGGGVAALAAARIVGEGKVVGADISAPLIALASGRGEAQSATNVSFVVADLQHETVPGGPFDAAISQFGVMFFDEPTTAFANIRRQVAGGGRLGFACWQALDLNRWFPGPALAGIAPPPPPPGPGKSPTHPFSLSDPHHTAGILEASGWREVNTSRHELLVTVDRDTIVDDEALGFFGVPADAIGDAWQAIERQLAPITRDDGLIDAPLAFHIFTATA
ncbi:MAG TPA: methyltransferase domain-containing protein [Solirubrobacteraceae bacterium]|nr:methyltransferase domain-containing protein [Solirubrobacteraceae bacterium]